MASDSAAAELQRIAINNATDQLANMANVESAVWQYATGLQKLAKILLPAWNAPAIVNPGIVYPGNAPEFSGSYTDKGAIGLTADFQALVEAKYHQLEPLTKTAVDNGINQFVQSFCQPYAPGLVALQDSLNAGLADTAITPAVRASWMTELENGLDKDRQAEVSQILSQGGFGYEVQQPSRLAAINRVNARFSDKLAEARTAIFNRSFELSLQYKQACQQVLNGMLDSLRQSFLQYASLQAGLLKHALDAATTIAEKGLQTRATEIAGFEDRRAAAQAVFNSLVEINREKLEVWKTQLNGLIEAKRLEYSNMQFQLEVVEFPYKAQLERNMKVAELEISAGAAALKAMEGIYAGLSRVAQAAESGINSIGVATVSE